MMEYIALGTPVIVSRTPTIEAYFDDSMVMFFEPGNVADMARCIQSLYEDRKRLAQFAHNADKFNQLYNWENVSTHYVGLVEELAGVNGKLPAQAGP
jgi:glycosyltransferase involved in cell wall biosynthesis